MCSAIGFEWEMLRKEKDADEKNGNRTVCHACEETKTGFQTSIGALIDYSKKDLHKKTFCKILLARIHGFEKNSSTRIQVDSCENPCFLSF